KDKVPAEPEPVPWRKGKGKLPTEEEQPERKLRYKQGELRAEEPEQVELKPWQKVPKQKEDVQPEDKIQPPLPSDFERPEPEILEIPKPEEQLAEDVSVPPWRRKPAKIKRPVEPVEEKPAEKYKIALKPTKKIVREVEKPTLP